MAAFTYELIKGKYPVLIAYAKKGDAHCFDVPENGNDSFGFATYGSTALLDQNGDLHTLLDTKLKPNTVNFDDCKGQPMILLAKEATDHHCILGCAGEVHVIPANESLTITGVQGRRLFLAEGAATVDDVEYPHQKILHLKTKDSVTVSAGDEEFTFVTFWKRQ
jgi:hypothetical protein